MPRLTKIYTRTGDNGTTGLGDGSRVEKDHGRVEAYGTVDELISWLGQLLTYDLPTPLPEIFIDIQHALFDIGSELSIPGMERIPERYVAQIEEHLDQLNAELPTLQEFILPGGTQAAACCHVARTVCRRAERRMYTLSKDEKINGASLKYVNRLSDFLFVAARYINKRENINDVLWQPGKLAGQDK